MNQTEFDQASSGKSQCDKILERLLLTPGQWVSTLELHQISESLAVHSRINDLRGRGMKIEQHSEHLNGKCFSNYRLVASK
jgi:hypothetical protein